jgi:hypothetical protein
MIPKIAVHFGIMYYAEDVWYYSIFSAKGDKQGNVYHRMKAVTRKYAYLAN